MEREQMIRNDALKVELADSSMIAELMDRAAASRPGRMRRSDRRTAPARRTQPRRCNCGTCRTCIDNAHWEMVFQKKFADPYYYQLHPPRQGSSLNGF